MRIELGMKARDAITGYEGLVYGKSIYLTGCTRIMLIPRSTSKEDMDGRWFDEDCLEILDANRFQMPGHKTAEQPDRSETARPIHPGGPMRNEESRR